jgi:hypothetical protein
MAAIAARKRVSKSWDAAKLPPLGEGLENQQIETSLEIVSGHRLPLHFLVLKD